MAEVYLGVSSPWRSDGGELRDGNAAGLRIDATGVVSVHAATEERLSGRRYDPCLQRCVPRVLQRLGASSDDDLHVAMSSALGPVFTVHEAHEVFRRATGLEPTSIMVVAHHDAHALEAFVPSPFSEALVVVTDSAGNHRARADGTSYWENQTIYRGSRLPNGGCNLEPVARDFLDQFGYGQLFRAVTRYVGFPGYHHASKVMAFAGIGHDREVRLPVPHEFSPEGEPRMRWAIDSDDPVACLRAWLDELGFDDGGPRDHSWFEAGSHVTNGRSSVRPTDIELSVWVQRGWEDQLLTRVGHLVGQTGISNICLGGGVALNCVANARLIAEKGVDRVHVGCAPGDHGQGLGNLYALLNELAPELTEVPAPPYFCPEGGLLDTVWNDRADEATALLADGRILAVCRGIAEYGPRALGHRSLLCTPVPAATERLRMVKQREDYQPFAVCVTEDYADAHLEGIASPFMSFAPRVRGQAASDLSDVVHDDGTCRVQTVSLRSDPWLHRVLVGLAEAGRPPLLVNTSLNLRGSPMVDRIGSSAEVTALFGVDDSVVAPTTGV